MLKLTHHTGDDYLNVLADLLPVGAAWPRDYDSHFMQLLAGFCQIFGTIDQRIIDFFVRESDPRTTRELLADWERAFGLPDECTAEALTIEDRINALLVKMTMVGDQSRQFFINVAKQLGYEIDIQEFSPFQVGISNVGNTDYQIGTPDIRFFWAVKLFKTRLSWFRAGSGQTGVDPHVRIGLASDLECLLRRWKPAHTEIIFDYSNYYTQEKNE